MTDPDCDVLVARLESCALTPAEFTHRAHVQAGFAYLQRLGFAGALGAMAQAIRRFAAHHGKEALYHETITVAFLTLIHERMAEELLARGAEDPMVLDWTGFAARHPGLFGGDLLARYYPKDVLGGALAKRCFVLPRPATKPVESRT